MAWPLTRTMAAMDQDRLYFRQLLSGRDMAAQDMVAKQMVNFSYLIGDRAMGVCVVVDPAYDVAGIVNAAAEDDMTVIGALVTHYHPDHIGGSMMGHTIEGLDALMELIPALAIHTQAAEAAGVLQVTNLSVTDLVTHEGGDSITVGSIPITFLHTPGHTPGSQSFLVDGRLVAGDTLFVEGCGRTDLPGSDAAQMYHSIHSVLAKVPDDAVLFPGHLYSPQPSAPMSDVRKTNFVYRFQSEEQWMKMFAQG